MEVEELLRTKGYFPLESPLWKSFWFNQVKSKNDAEKQSNYKYLEEQVEKKKGVYVYENEFGQVLYVGKGSPIF